MKGTKENRFGRKWLQRAIFLSALTLAFVLPAAESHAAGLFPSPRQLCDPEHMDALDARGYIEAQREISQNENLIQKPEIGRAHV